MTAPYLTAVSANSRWRYFHTRRQYRFRTVRMLGVTLIVTSYRRLKDKP